MNRAWVAASALALTGCATSSLVLLPDEDGQQGSVAVLEADGKPVENLIGEGNTRTRLGSAGARARPLGTKGLKQRESALVGGLPPAPRSFTLYFDQGTTTLTPRSQTVLADVRMELAARTGAEIEVTGHTDTVGGDDDNDRLSQRRAEEVLAWLVSQGFDRETMSAVGRGERELKQATGDNVPSEENRRVEVVVR
jgi:OOP family OmpA-OmpF porin